MKPKYYVGIVTADGFDGFAYKIDTPDVLLESIKNKLKIVARWDKEIGTWSTKLPQNNPNVNKFGDINFIGLKLLSQNYRLKPITQENVFLKCL